MNFAKILIICVFTTPVNLFADAIAEFNALKDAGLIVQNSGGNTRLASREDQYFIPASTTKLVTAWLALDHWGEHKRFITDFFFDAQTFTLTIKGYGDPFLVSEEIRLIAEKLKEKGLKRIETIRLDDSAFAQSLALPGTGKTDNPYDAIPSAIAANFNTIYAKRVGESIQSAEKQTPLTAFSRRLGQSQKGEIFRINTGSKTRDAGRYFAELLLAMLHTEGVAIKYNIEFIQSVQAPVFYRHENTKTLAEMIRPMMKYSTNFIANQLILMLTTEHFSRPANAEDVRLYMANTLSEKFNWDYFILEEGAGLSRKNRLSPLQLLDVLKSFIQWRHLLPEIEKGIFAKSGTLESVSTLAGYIVLKDEWQPFAVMMNQAVPFKLRNKIATQLREKL